MAAGTELRNALRWFGSSRAQVLQLRVSALLLFLLGLALTFSPQAFELAGKFTERPEFLPVTLLVPYVYLIFQVVLWELDRDDASLAKQQAYKARVARLPELRADRSVTVDLFSLATRELPSLSAQKSSGILTEWMVDAVRQEGRLQVDLLAFSSETFLAPILAVVDHLEELQEPDLLPERVHIRLLMRNLDSEWTAPLLQQQDADEAYQRALKGRFRQFIARWPIEVPASFGRIIVTSKLQLEFRTYDAEPLLKGAVVNGSKGLLGIYDFHRVSHEGVDGWDYHGHGASMKRMFADGSAQEVATLGQYCDYYDRLWSEASPTVLV